MNKDNRIYNLNFLSQDRVRELAEKHGTPIFVYSRSELVKQAAKALNFLAPHGLTVRYAMKANPHPEVVMALVNEGLSIDASSAYEAQNAIDAGVAPSKIRLASQELAKNLRDLHEKGVKFTACSLRQLEEFGKIAAGSSVGVRINPGEGHGYNLRNTTAGVSTSFGIWHEYIDKVQEIAEQYKLNINMLHTHIGSGSDPAEWLRISKRNFDLLRLFPTVTTTSLGGGYKVDIMDASKSADLDKISKPISDQLVEFEKQTGRKIHLEIEPGKFLAMNAGTIIAEVNDIKDTGKDGHEFLVLNAGMTEILRPSMYGAQHPIVIVPVEKDETREHKYYGVAGHCCETGDTLTVAAGDPEGLEPRLLARAEVGDYVCIEATGAYCASMRATGYNAFPKAEEVYLKD